jgi:hypothetical protein
MPIAGKFEVLLPGNHRADNVRTTFRSRMEKLYIGWDDNFDRQYDNHSFLFLLSDHSGRFLANCRVVFKHRGQDTFLTPMEMGDVSKFLIPVQDKTACECGMMSFVSKEAALVLSYCVCRWLTENQVSRCFVTHDVRNILMKRLYTQKLGFSRVDGAIVQFSEFKSRKSGRAVEWQVLGTTLERSLEVLGQLHLDSGGFPYDSKDYPKLGDWLERDREIAHKKEAAALIS